MESALLPFRTVEGVMSYLAGLRRCGSRCVDGWMACGLVVGDFTPFRATAGAGGVWANQICGTPLWVAVMRYPQALRLPTGSRSAARA